MTIVIIGAGYVDLHLAIAFAKHFRVIMIVILKIKKNYHRC
jgi:UDP-glucose 6-dehydrogenase